MGKLVNYYTNHWRCLNTIIRNSFLTIKIILFYYDQINYTQHCCNYSSRKLDFKNFERGLHIYDKYYYNAFDLTSLISYSILDYINIGLIYQLTLFNNIRITSDVRQANQTVNKSFYNNLFGYQLGLKYSNFNLAFQYLPHSTIFPTSLSWIDLFPFNKSRNIQVLLSYEYKLFNVKWKQSNSKVNCPSF